MKYADLPFVDRPVSRLVFGTAIRPMYAGEEVFELLDAAWEVGINCFDTALAYGEAEVSLGDWIKARGLQGKAVVLTKGCTNTRWRVRVTPHELYSDFLSSLARLRLEKIDIYLIHRDVDSAPIEPMVEVLNELHAKGLIGAFGASNTTPARLERANAYAAQNGLVPMSVSSPAFSLARMLADPDSDWGASVSIAGDTAAQDWYRAHPEIRLFTYSGLARGFLSGKVSSDKPEAAKELLGYWGATEYAYPENFERLRRLERLAGERGVAVSQLALAWDYHQGLPLHALSSASSVAHLRESVAALEMKLSAHECAWLDLREDAL